MSREKNMQKLFLSIKQRLLQRKSASTLQYESGNRFFTATDKANALSVYFSSVFNPLGSSCPLVTTKTYSTCPVPLISYCDVLKQLKSVKGSLSATSDGIPSIFYKKLADHLYQPLTHIFNISLITGEVPALWKRAMVTPIPKTTCGSHLTDFRPISILPTSCKIMEKLVTKAILEWTDKVKCIPEEQYGFIPGCSTATQLIQCSHDWVNSLTRGDCVEIIYFDLSKAFDTVDHLSLISVLESIGIRGTFLSWFESYLGSREFSVRFQGQTSGRKPCTSGVPQGSALSPLLFNIYTMDLPSVLKTDPCVKVAAYADDIKIYAAYSPNERIGVQEKLKLAVQEMLNWAKKWGIKINISKSQILKLGETTTETNTNTDYGIPLGVREKVRDLGIIVDSFLRYSPHIEAIACNATRIMYSVLRNVHTSETTILLRLYKALHYRFLRLYLIKITSYGGPFSLIGYHMMKDLLQMPLPDTYEDRLWITKILNHMSYDEAFQRRHDIPFRPYKKDRTANIHCNWVYLVEWELFNGEFIHTWEIEDQLIHLPELDVYKEKYVQEEERSRVFTRYHWTSSEDEEDEQMNVTNTTTTAEQ
ncbi:hypothetical protein Y032_0230g2972 [Ancylostoma ceylanicum]|uniref:Reverse transcriptase domain-containing protein n=2 Tax=Ancylostoma ceylanicum TaxID=53326 RepID=A0A016SGX6_9BILA|nr:hypothetical protein Y032_0230g2972 [Ancylostoma ceylanicum]